MTDQIKSPERHYNITTLILEHQLQRDLLPTQAFKRVMQQWESTILAMLFVRQT